MSLRPLLLLSFAVGCSAPPQVLTGRIATGFPMTITSVTVTTSHVQSWHGDAVVATAAVATDGTFHLSLPPMGGLRIQLLGTGNAKIVFPRHTGTIERSFAIRPNGVAFDLGAVHYVGAASTTSFAFNTTSQCDGDGHDANGATCVDDGDQNHGQCGDNSDDNSGEGDQGGGGGAEPADSAEADDAVAEHNFPADGCADGGDNGGDPGGGDGGD